MPRAVYLVYGIQGYDPDKDVAVLKIDAAPETLRPIALGVSNTLKASELIVKRQEPRKETSWAWRDSYWRQIVIRVGL